MLGESTEVLYINDGSTDGTLVDLKALDGVTIVNLNRNYGQAVALDAGFRHASGAYVATLDGDGQNDPADIPAMLKKLIDEDLDVVAGWRKDRKDSNGINILTLIGRALRNFAIKDGVHDTGCTLRVYRKEATDTLDIGGEMHRYVLALLRWKGFRIGEMVVRHRARVHGVSKYNYSKAVRGLIDLMYIWFIHKYSQRPLHLFGYMSIVSFFLLFAAGFWTLYGKFVLGTSLNRNGWFFITFFLLLAAIIFFSFGIVMDFLIRIHLNNSAHETRYLVRGVIRNEGRDEGTSRTLRVKE